MGYQESLLTCKDEHIFKELCYALNTIKPDISGIDGVTVYALGKVKTPVLVSSRKFYEGWSFNFEEGTFFVLWGGNRHPCQDQDWLAENLYGRFGISCECTYIEYIDDMDAFTDGIKFEYTGSIQENDSIYYFEIPDKGDITDEYIDYIINA